MEKAESVVLKKIHSSLHFVLKDVTVVMVNFSMKANVSLKTNVLASTMVINILLGQTFSKTAMNGKIFFKDLFLLKFLILVSARILSGNAQTTSVIKDVQPLVILITKLLMVIIMISWASALIHW